MSQQLKLPGLLKGDSFADPRLNPKEKPRLSRQCELILSRLREGPAKNTELVAIALKYTGRISDIRKAGYVVEVIERDYETGITLYALRGDNPDS